MTTTPAVHDEDPIDWNHATAAAVARKAIMWAGVPVHEAERYAFLAVDAIIHAGLLLPTGTETRTEWATRLKAHGEYDEELSESWANSVMTEEERARNRAHHWRRRFAPELVDVMRRDVHITPWVVAEDKP